MNKRKVIKLLLVIVWMGLIFMFSNENGKESTKTSDTFLYKIVEVITSEKLTKDDKIELTNKYMFIVRKCAHFFLYFVLAILVFIYLKEYIDISPSIVIYTIIFVIIYASSDEIHQLFISNRSGSIKDVMIDTSGGITSTLISYFICKFKSKK